jgi:putative toxin-antitoxin system antitoxin component (TIGR02293 family)
MPIRIMTSSSASAQPSAAPEASASVGWSIGQDAADLDALLARIEAGFAADSVEALRARLGLSIEEMAGLLVMSARTLGRRLEEGKLTAEESDRLYRYARLFERAVEVLGSEGKARTWLKKKHWALGGRVPLEIGRYEPGAREIKHLLGRIEHGIPL